MKILVTGAGGFIGSHLTETLLKEGHEVIAMVRYGSEPRIGWLEGIEHPKLTIEKGDITDPWFVETVANGCDAICHLAALIGIPYSYQAPQYYVSVNVQGTLNVLQAARKLKISRTIVTSTSEVYGTAQFVPMTEEHPLNAQSPYAATKVAADQLANSFARSFELPVLVLRPFNTYGPRQSFRAVLPSIIEQALRGDTITLGNLDAVRDLTFAEDTANAFVCALQAKASLFDGRTIHLGTGKGYSIRELVEITGKALGKSLKIVSSEDRLRPGRSEVEQLISDPSKAKSELGWSAKVDINQGVDKLAKFLQAHRARLAQRKTFEL